MVKGWNSNRLKLNFHHFGCGYRKQSHMKINWIRQCILGRGQLMNSQMFVSKTMVLMLMAMVTTEGSCSCASWRPVQVSRGWNMLYKLHINVYIWLCIESMENKTFKIKGFVIILHVAHSMDGLGVLSGLRLRLGGVLLVVFSNLLQLQWICDQAGHNCWYSVFIYLQNHRWSWLQRQGQYILGYSEQ